LANTTNVVIDNNILDVLYLQDDDKLPLNSLHILEECNIPTIRCSQDKHKIDKYGNNESLSIHPHESLQYQSYLVHYQCLYLQSN
jgi:hypothetical protein